MVLLPRKTTQTQSTPNLIPPLPRLPSLAALASPPPSTRGVGARQIYSERGRSQSSAHLRGPGPAIYSERGRGHWRYDERGRRVLEPISPPTSKDPPEVPKLADLAMLAIEGTGFNRKRQEQELDEQLNPTILKPVKSARRLPNVFEEIDPSVLNAKKQQQPMGPSQALGNENGNEPSGVQWRRQREQPQSREESMDRLVDKAKELASAAHLPPPCGEGLLRALAAEQRAERVALRAAVDEAKEQAQRAAEADAVEQLSKHAARHDARKQKSRSRAQSRKNVACVRQLVKDLEAQGSRKEELKWHQWMAWASETKRQQPDEDVIRVLEDALQQSVERGIDGMPESGMIRAKSVPAMLEFPNKALRSRPTPALNLLAPNLL